MYDVIYLLKNELPHEAHVLQETARKAGQIREEISNAIYMQPITG